MVFQIRKAASWISFQEFLSDGSWHIPEYITGKARCLGIPVGMACCCSKFEPQVSSAQMSPELITARQKSLQDLQGWEGTGHAAWSADWYYEVLSQHMSCYYCVVCVGHPCRIWEGILPLPCCCWKAKWRDTPGPGLGALFLFMEWSLVIISFPVGFLRMMEVIMFIMGCGWGNNGPQ